MEEHLISYKKTYQQWDSALGRWGLKATIRETETLIAEIEAELSKRDIKETEE